MSVLSERDQKRKTGGTRDTVGLWPYPKNHVSINPDLYINGVVEPIIEEAQQFQPVSSRPVLYVVCCDLAPDEKLNKAVMLEMESGSLPTPIVLEIKDNQLLAGFKTVFGAMELCEAIAKIMVKPFQQNSNIRMSLHVGPIHINPEILKQELSGDVISMIERLHKLTLSGSIYATGVVAAVLALENKKYSFDYIDTLPTPGEAKDLDVFRVNVHHTIVTA